MRDLDELAAYIGEQSEQGAALVEERVHDAARLISQFPRAGRIGRCFETRERFVIDTPYILVYQILKAKIRVLRVYHAARRWPSRFE